MTEPSMLEIGPVVAVIVVLLVAAVVRRITNRRRIQAWAASNGLEVVRYEERPILRGPFFWNSSNHQIVYFVVVRARDGTEKSGFVRFGGYLVGLFSKRCDVIWR